MKGNLKENKEREKNEILEKNTESTKIRWWKQIQIYQLQ